MTPVGHDTVYDFTAVSIDGLVVPLSQYRGAVLLVVNVASRCGYTPQYAALEMLYRRHRERGFVVLGFPCNQFGKQEPAPDEDIQAFCSSAYAVTFPLFAKIAVNGPDAHPLYRFLKARGKGWLGSERVKWNFTKFLVHRDGSVARRYGPADAPASIEPAIVSALADDA
jgi:glutathione peroxidase